MIQIPRLTGLGWFGTASVLVVKRRGTLPVAFFLALYGMAENGRVAGPLEGTYRLYLGGIRHLSNGLQSIGFHHTRSVVCGLLGDLNGVVALVTQGPAPRLLSDPLLTPVILIHGKFGNPAEFASLHHALGRRPVIAVELPDPGPLTDVDLQIVQKALDQVGEKAHLLGYSRGAEVARAFIDHEKIGKIALIGTPLGSTPPGHLLEIAAAWDLLVPGSPEAIVVDRCGHVGLLTHPRVLGLVATWFAH